MKEVGNEFYCRDCEHTARTEERVYECPKCGSGDIFNSSFITCGCGTTVYLGGFTNECEGCGMYYNGSGQMLAPPDQWDDDDRYACFGPQN